MLRVSGWPYKLFPNTSLHVVIVHLCSLNFVEAFRGFDVLELFVEFWRIDGISGVTLVLRGAEQGESHA